MNWHDRYKAMKKGLVLTNSDIANIIGNTSDSVKSTTQPNKELPRWLKLAIVVFERMSKQMNMKDTIVEDVIGSFKERSEVGIKKYNKTMDRSDLSSLEWLQHLQEELMDATLYIEKLKKELK